MHRLTYVSHAHFLAADARRQRDTVELGHDWRDGQHPCRVCWYEQTGELTLERLDPHQPLALENFHAGVSGPTEIIAIIPHRTALDRLLGDRTRPAAPTAAWLRATAERLSTSH